MADSASRSPDHSLILRLDPNPDSGILAQVDSLCFSENSEGGDWDEVFYRQLMASTHVEGWVLYAADDPSEPLGMLCRQRVEDEAELFRIGITPRARRRGLGHWLLEAFLDDQRKSGVRFVRLEVRESNIAARKLYARSGFTEAGRRPGYYRSSEAGSNDDQRTDARSKSGRIIDDRIIDDRIIDDMAKEGPTTEDAVLYLRTLGEE